LLGIALGSLALLMLHHLTGGMWGLVIRRILEAATRTLALLAILFLPIAFGLDSIYPWATSAPADEMRRNYLNVPFFLVRAGIYFALWVGMAWLVNRWSAEEDRTRDPSFARLAQRFSGPALALYGLAVTFAAIDWIMSLEPDWYSTIFGVLVATSQLLPALAVAIAAATWLATRPPLADVASADVWNDLGNLLLAFVMLWTYMSFSQLLLIWAGNLPEEIVWYVHRSEGGWQIIGIALAACYFALPFFLLLSRDIKRRPERLRVVALALVVMSVVHHHWLIAPAFSPGSLRVHWMDVTALFGIGGLWLAAYFRQIEARPLLPVQAGELLSPGTEGVSHA